MTNSSVPSLLSPNQSLTLTLKRLKLSHILAEWQEIEHRATQENWSYAQFLLALCEGEANRRDQTRIVRALSEAQLPCGKSFSNFEFTHVPSLNPATVMSLAQDGEWLNRAENILVFGPSGVGKTHLASAIARSMVELGHRVKFMPATVKSASSATCQAAITTGRRFKQT